MAAEGLALANAEGEPGLGVLVAAVGMASVGRRETSEAAEWEVAGQEKVTPMAAST